MRTPILEQFKTWARENHDLAMAVVKAQAYAQTMREQVDKIQRQVLKEVPLYDDLIAEHNHTERHRITDPKDTYLSKDDAAFQRYVMECSNRERAAGLKPATMPDEYCPALVAEDLQRKAERVLLDSGGSLFGISADDMVQPEHWREGLRLMLGASLKEPGASPRRHSKAHSQRPRLSR